MDFLTANSIQFEWNGMEFWLKLLWIVYKSRQNTPFAIFFGLMTNCWTRNLSTLVVQYTLAAYCKARIVVSFEQGFDLTSNCKKSYTCYFSKVALIRIYFQIHIAFIQNRGSNGEKYIDFMNLRKLKLFITEFLIATLKLLMAFSPK